MPKSASRRNETYREAQKAKVPPPKPFPAMAEPGRTKVSWNMFGARGSTLNQEINSMAQDVARGSLGRPQIEELMGGTAGRARRQRESVSKARKKAYGF